MLAQIRAFAKSPFATLLLGILVVSFGVWGIRDVFSRGGFSNSVVKAGSRPPIGSADFKEIFTQAKAQQEQRVGQPISLEDAVKFNLDRSLADELAATEATGALMNQEGVAPADSLIAGEIRKIPAFFNPVTGQFDQRAYAAALAERHLTTAQADAQFRDTVAQRHYLTALAGGLRAPRIYALVQSAIQLEGRNFAWIQLGPSAVPPPPKPTDAELQAFMKENAAQLTRPELRQISIVRFSAAQMAQSIAAPADQVQKRFDFEKDSLNTPEKRSVAVIAVKTAAAGKTAADRLKAGADPQTAAKAAGGSAEALPPSAKAAMPDRKVADAAFGLKAGEVAGPIQGDLGLVVIKVLDVQPAKTVTLAEARPKIEEKIKGDLAKEKVYEAVQKYEDAHGGGSPMADAAKAANTPVIVVPAAIAKTGVTLAGQRANIPPKVLQTAFSLPQGGESDVLDLGQGEYWVVKVDKVIPSALFGLDETVQGTSIRDVVTRQFMLRELFKRLRAKADALTAEIAKGKSLDAVAAEVNAKVNEASHVTRAAARPAAANQPPAYSSDLLGRLFAAKVGEVVVGEDTRPGLIIARLKAISEPPAPVLAVAAEGQRAQISRSLFEDMGVATRQAALKKIKPTVDYKRARQALGVDADTAPAGAPKS